MTAQINIKRTFSLSLKVLLSLLMFLFVIFPILFILTSLGDVDFGGIVSSELFAVSLFNSLITTVFSTVLSVLFSFCIAYAISRSQIRFKGIIAVILSVPMLIPSISHGMGILVLFGSNGILSGLFGLKDGIGGFAGIVLGGIQYSFPVAFLMFTDILRYEDQHVYQAAEIMGISKFRQFTGITLPYLTKPMISILFATFTLIFTDYGVPMMVGGRVMTLPLYMYQEVVGQLNFGVGGIAAIFLIFPALIAFIFDIFKKDSSSSVSGDLTAETVVNIKRDIIVYILCAFAIVAVLFPVIAFSIIGFVIKYPSDLSFTFDNIFKVFNMNAGQFLFNSLGISVIVAEVGTVFSYLIAYLTARVPSKYNKILHLISIFSLAIPGVVLGIGYSLMYGGTFLMGSIAIIIMVNTVHFFSSPYLMCYNALNKVNKKYEIVSQTLKISRFRLIKDIMIPETLDTILEMFSYFFVNGMVTISAVSFIASYNTKPLALMINSFEAQMLLECAAFVSLLILCVNVILKIAIYLIKRAVLIDRNKDNNYVV